MKQEELERAAIELYPDSPHDGPIRREREQAVRRLAFQDGAKWHERYRLESNKGSHPEDYCHECGEKNIVWHAPNDLFNTVNGSPNGIMCPECFRKKAKKLGVNIGFTAEVLNDPKYDWKRFNEEDMRAAYEAGGEGEYKDTCFELWLKERNEQ